MSYCIFLLLIYMSIYAYVCVLFWWFCWKYFRLHDTKHNGLKISPLSKTEIQQRKKIYHNVSRCCAEAQNSHCGLWENNFRQCYVSCFEALNYKLWEYLILLASAFPLAKKNHWIAAAKTILLFIRYVEADSDHTEQKMELNELEASSSTWISLNCITR